MSSVSVFRMKQKDRRDELEDVRKEECTGIGGGAVLAEEPQMFASCEALQTRPETRITIVLSQLEGLVHPIISISQIRRLRSAEVNAQALRPTGEDTSSQDANHTTPEVRPTIQSHSQIAQSHRSSGPQASSDQI